MDMKKTNKIRTFESGAIRDSGNEKYDYYGFRHPLLEQYFAKYMHQHRKMADGSYRKADNWWAGWDKEVSLQSLVRHVEDLTALHAGYNVYEVRDNEGVRKIYTNDKMEGEGITQINEVDCCCAIRFNSMAFLLEHLK